MPTHATSARHGLHHAVGMPHDHLERAGARPAERVLRLQQNERGRDFVVGDIHGAYDLVLQAMRQVNFDGERDRLFAVGDLIDRGPDSWRCVRFLRKPYVYSVRGNHDDALVGLYEDGEPSQQVLEVVARHFGMQWWLTTEPPLRAEILEALAQLPFAIEVQSRRGTVGIVHGDVPAGMHWSSFLDHVARGTPYVLEDALEGRNRILSGDDSGVPGVGRLFVGHTTRRGGAKRYGNVYAIDTGAIFNVLQGKDHYGLTMTQLAAATAQIVCAGEGAVPQVAVVDDANSIEPFGPYTRAWG